MQPKEGEEERGKNIPIEKGERVREKIFKGMRRKKREKQKEREREREQVWPLTLK